MVVCFIYDFLVSVQASALYHIICPHRYKLLPGNLEWNVLILKVKIITSTAISPKRHGI